MESFISPFLAWLPLSSPFCLVMLQKIRMARETDAREAHPLNAKPVCGS
jgi:hypothetical protein